MPPPPITSFPSNTIPLNEQINCVYYNNTLLSKSLSLPPPIIGIGIEHEHTTIRKTNVEDVTEEDENGECRPL